MIDYKELIERLRMCEEGLCDRCPAYKNGIAQQTDCETDVMKCAADAIEELLNVSENPTGWTPVSEGLPEDLQEVNVTWVNRKPESYYADIKDKPFTATAVFYGGNWYWYTAQVTDYLGEYGECDTELIDSGIEITAWQPLPEPYKWEEE